MEDARLGSILMIGALQVMLEVVGQFGLYYSEQTEGILRSLGGYAFPTEQGYRVLG